jgi:hypothetical protein
LCLTGSPPTVTEVVGIVFIFRYFSGGGGDGGDGLI